MYLPSGIDGIISKPLFFFFDNHITSSIPFFLFENDSSEGEFNPEISVLEARSEIP